MAKHTIEEALKLYEDGEDIYDIYYATGFRKKEYQERITTDMEKARKISMGITGNFIKEWNEARMKLLATKEKE